MLPRAVIAVHQLAVADGRDHGGDRPDVVVVPGAQQAAADQVVDLALVRRERRALGRGGGGDDGVVVGDLGIVHEAAAQRTLAGAGRKLLAIRRGDGLDDARQGLRHVLREVPAVGARIADQLVSLVERLRDVQRLLRAEAEQAVGVALQFGQIVERRRRHALRLRFDGFDGGLAGARARFDAAGLFAIGRQAHGILSDRETRCPCRRSPCGAPVGWNVATTSR